MEVHHKPQFTVKQSPNGKWRFRVSRNAPQKGDNKLENQLTSQLYDSKYNAERGFKDASKSMLLIMWERGELIDNLEETGLLVKLGGAL